MRSSRRAPRTPTGHARRCARWTGREQVAAAVALKQLGYDVKANPNGVIVDVVAADVPATGKLQAERRDRQRATGRPCGRPATSGASSALASPATPSPLGLREGATTRRVTVDTVAVPTDHNRPVIGIGVSQSRDDPASGQGQDRPRRRRRPLGRARVRARRDGGAGRDVDRGHKVAATGELELDGTVAPIGGAASRRRSERGARVWMFSSSRLGTTRARRGARADGLRIIPVESFQQALRALATLPRKT